MMMLIALCLPVVLMFAAFGINVAWMQRTRTELRTATDASVRAAGRTLSLSQNVDAARAAAVEAASRNTIAGAPLILVDADVVFGKSLPDGGGKYAFTATADDSKGITGVRVTGSRTEGSASGPIPLLFTGFFDRDSFEPIKTAVATQIDRDVVLVLDRSGSMGTATPGGDRWSDLKLAVAAFLNTLGQTPQDEKTGVVTYSSEGTLDENLNLDYPLIMSTVHSKSPSGNTAIGPGLLEAIEAIRDPAYARSNSQKTIVLMTDGIHNTGAPPDDIAKNAYENFGIIVHTITFSEGADQAAMQIVAAKGGGKHWHADNQAALIAVFKEVANNLPTLITE
jgi:Ca-activated chloride channel family protein